MKYNCSAHRSRLEDYGSDEAVPCESNDYHHAVREGFSDSYDIRLPRAVQKRQGSVASKVWHPGNLLLNIGEFAHVYLTLRGP